MAWIAATMDGFKGRYPTKRDAVRMHSYASPPRAKRVGRYYEAVGTLDQPTWSTGVYIMTEALAKKDGWARGPWCAVSQDHDESTTTRCNECDIHLCAECWRAHRCGRSDSDASMLPV